jgi:NADH kinase
LREETANSQFLSLQWPSPPRNILLTKKNNTPEATEKLVEFAKYIKSTYDDPENGHTLSIILEPHAAAEIHDRLPFPVYTTPRAIGKSIPALHEKVDLIATFGGDGTILHAAALFATAKHVPPMLSFSMGTLGFLGNWKFVDHKRAFREVYGSGGDSNDARWSSLRGRTMGSSRAARVLLRNRLKVSVLGPDGQRISSSGTDDGEVYAMNEVVMHRGRSPHLTIIDVFLNGQFLTEAQADGMIISTPTGSTAYSLSSGGSIVHPLVPSLLLTPISPRSLSFRPLLLPANQPITLRLSPKNRSSEVEVSIDGVGRPEGLSLGSEVRVWGESVKDVHGTWEGGVPSLVRGAISGDPCGQSDDPWGGGLVELLQFNRPFGQDN